MTIIPEWDNDEKTIIRISYPEQWSWEDHQAFRVIMAQMLDEVDHKVDIISDLRQTVTIPSGALRMVRQIYLQPNPKIGVTMVVGINPMIRALYKSFTLLYPPAKNVYMLADSLDDAYSKIAQIQQDRQDEE